MSAQRAQVDVKEAVAHREQITEATLADAARQSVSSSKISRELSRTLLLELKRRFLLIRGQRNPDGSRRQIDGATSFNAWMEINRVPKRAVFYLLNGRARKKPFLTLRLSRLDVECLLSAVPQGGLRERIVKRLHAKGEK